MRSPARFAKNTVDGWKVDLLSLVLDLIWAGFPCVAASSNNKHSGSDQNRQCMRNQELATGSVFAAIFDFLKDLVDRGAAPLAVTFENVWGLLGGNLEYLNGQMATISFMAVTFTLDSHVHFGSATSRPRLWIVCLQISSISMLRPGAIEGDVLSQAEQQGIGDHLECLMQRFSGMHRHV